MSKIAQLVKQAPGKQSTKIRTSFNIDVDKYEQFRETADELGLKLSSIIEALIEDFIDKHSTK